MIGLIIRGEKCLKKVFLLYLLKRFVFPSKEKEKKNYVGGGEMDHMADSRHEILKIHPQEPTFSSLKCFISPFAQLKGSTCGRLCLKKYRDSAKATALSPL